MVRPYALTRGRTTGAGADMDMLTIVCAVVPAPVMRFSDPEYAAIMGVCHVPLAVAEVSAMLHLPLAVTKILVGDLVAAGSLAFQPPCTTKPGADDVGLLHAVLEGIRRI
ncbi:DUF742 domain-containing protein [Nocardia sp. XZ_19_231]|uniref:DUF742 domain-containing protein n=1 Tax=Nocardia sp. XZ_19_231 TaxID=2769252 RepID=UPI00351C31DE